MVRQPTLKQLKYLCAVAEQGHFGNAARACHVSQSTLSAGILELEDALGQALARAERLYADAKSDALRATGGPELIGASAAIGEVRRLIDRIAPTETTASKERSVKSSGPGSTRRKEMRSESPRAASKRSARANTRG